MRNAHKHKKVRKKQKHWTKENKKVKTKLLLIVSLGLPKNVYIPSFNLLCSQTYIIAIFFLSSFPCLTKPKHWTRVFWCHLAAKGSDQMFVSGPHWPHISLHIIKASPCSRRFAAHPNCTFF